MKVVVVIIIVILLIPLVMKLWPEPLTFGAIQQAFEQNGFDVANAREVQPAGLEAAAQVSMSVDGARVDIYRYDDRGVIAKQIEYQKPDAGTVIVESWNLAESLGAAQPKKLPFAAGRNGMFMLTVTAESKALCNRIVATFKKA